MNPRHKCGRCGVSGWKVCPDCRGQVDWETECWELDDRTSERDAREGKKCGACGEVLTSPVYEVGQVKIVWTKHGKRQDWSMSPIPRLACSVECAKAIDVKMTLSR